MRNEPIDIRCERNTYGAWVCSAVVNDRVIHRQYYFYTKRAAIRLFRESLAAGSETASKARAASICERR